MTQLTKELPSPAKTEAQILFTAQTSIVLPRSMVHAHSSSPCFMISTLHVGDIATDSNNPMRRSRASTISVITIQQTQRERGENSWISKFPNTNKRKRKQLDHHGLPSWTETELLPSRPQSYQILSSITILEHRWLPKRTYDTGMFEEKKTAKDIDADALVSDVGFTVPDNNAFGQSFRDYAESERHEVVEECYRLQHLYQTYDFVKRMREEYSKLDKAEMSIWECCELLNEVVDDSDPDLDEPQIMHLLQSAEAIRKDYPNDDWLHLTALIHDLGKILLLPKFGGLPQWAVVGDTFPVGCAFDESNVHYKYFKGNPDYDNPKYNTKNGVYTEGCGLNNVLMSYGHDDYMYLVAKENGTTLPSAALFIIRYHSFYPLHKCGAYMHLMDEEDVNNFKWLKIFNKYDLYSKSKDPIDIEKVKPYYFSLIEKYFPAKLKW